MPNVSLYTKFLFVSTWFGRNGIEMKKSAGIPERAMKMVIALIERDGLGNNQNLNRCHFETNH